MQEKYVPNEELDPMFPGLGVHEELTQWDMMYRGHPMHRRQAGRNFPALKSSRDQFPGLKGGRDYNLLNEKKKCFRDDLLEAIGTPKSSDHTSHWSWVPMAKDGSFEL